MLLVRLAMEDLVRSERFDVIRRLGHGGMGVVFEVFDREQEARCALKLLPKTTPRALLSFKHEFRALQGISHPNLISLGELLSEEDRWFFTMELVRGVDFTTWVRGAPAPRQSSGATLTLDENDYGRARAVAKPSARVAPAFDERRLRAALVQLLEGLGFLHASGKVHRDVKPSNVLVTEAGRVVVLDFGLVADGSSREPITKLEGPVQGTPAYMAPEQGRGAEVGPAADLYAVGVMLFEALTGARPFGDGCLESVAMRSALPALHPRDVAPELPEDLGNLCADLLDPDPSRRPTARDVLALLGATAATGDIHERRPFVGRREELSCLIAAFEESSRRPMLVTLRGSSGIGKTALLDELTNALEARSEQPLVLRGRCYEHEGIPYKAIDGVIDELGRHLSVTGAILPSNVSVLGLLFPVLCRVPGFAPLPVAARDAHETRRDAERALLTVISWLATTRPIVICIDDFQWADADSATFLTALGRGSRAPPLLLVLASRGEVSLPFEGEVRHVDLSPLSPEEARGLAEALLAESGQATGAVAEAIATEAEGHPLFVHELARRPDRSPNRSARSQLEDVLWERISARDPGARRMLEYVAVAAAPIPQSVVAEAAQLDPASLARAAQELRAERLIRTTGIRRSDDAETYHDRIRELVVGKLDPATLSARHLSLGRAFEHQRPDDLDALVTHFEGAGETMLAAEYAVRAGDAATVALAFDRAASFYRRAIARLPPAARRAERLRRKLAESLANAGMAADAAVEFERAAAESEPEHALELRRRAAEHWLSSGRLDEGMIALRAVLSQVRVRVPKSTATALVSLLLHRARVGVRGSSFVERGASEIDPADLLRIDALWAAAARLGAIDTIRAADFQARHLLRCLEAGEPFRITRALLAEAAFASMGGPKRWDRTAELLTRARSIAERIDVPYATAMLHFAEGFAEYQRGRYQEGHALLERAAELFRTTCTGASHDVAISKRFAIDCLFDLGELGQMRTEVPLLLEDAERRGDLYLAAELRTGLPNAVWLCADKPDEARRVTELGIAPWPRTGFFLQHYYHALASAQIALYEGDGALAHRIVESAWWGLRKSLLLQVQAVRTEALFLRARAAIAARGSRAFAIAKQTAISLDADTVPAARGYAAATRAGIAARSGDVEAELACLRTAERSFVAADAGMYAAACRYHIGRISGSKEQELEAGAWMRAHGVDRPESFARLLVPGRMP